MRTSLIVLLTALPASAQTVQTEIYNGMTRTVRYSTAGLSPSAAQIARDRERLENEAAFLREVGELKRSYIASERLIEPVRRGATLASLTPDYNPIWSPVYGMGYGYGYGYAPGFGGPRSVFPGGAYASFWSAPSYGPVDDGVLKASLSRTIAAQATPEYAALVDRASDRAVARASSERSGGGIKGAADESPVGVVLTLKDGETVRGLSAKTEGPWLVVQVTKKKTLKIRESEVMKIETNAE